MQPMHAVVDDIILIRHFFKKKNQEFNEVIFKSANHPKLLYKQKQHEAAGF